ncbi:MAG TPA: acetamidase/formamidase family protein, partial [Beijerinckiaceae bacterium]|nr:acetamidase/formamidase family protein [Beijerinckiaceae bacterium]
MPSLRLDPDPCNVHWGFFDAKLAPVLTIPNGGRVTISTVSGGEEVMPPSPFVVPPQLRAVHEKVKPKLQGHICTGPVAVEGAKKGQVLQVDVEAIEPFYDWGYQVVRPLAGALPDDFAESRIYHIALDRGRKLWRLPWGQEVPLKPFFGVMGTAPPAAWGA